jgi:hypothetical protein
MSLNLIGCKFLCACPNIWMLTHFTRIYYLPLTLKIMGAWFQQFSSKQTKQAMVCQSGMWLFPVETFHLSTINCPIIEIILNVLWRTSCILTHSTLWMNTFIVKRFTISMLPSYSVPHIIKFYSDVYWSIILQQIVNLCQFLATADTTAVELLTIRLYHIVLCILTSSTSN